MAHYLVVRIPPPPMSPPYVAPPCFSPLPLVFLSLSLSLSLSLCVSLVEFNGPTMYEPAGGIIERKRCDKMIGPVTFFPSSRARIVN